MDKKRLRLIKIIAIIFIITCVGLVIWTILKPEKNPYGDSIKIQNYSSLVKNISKDYEFKISSLLYSIVSHNSSDKINGNDVKDAFIRNNTATQNEIKANAQYSGSFIVDIDSLKQTYIVQYSYSTNTADLSLGGYPLLISCVSGEDVIYTNFKCKNLNDDDSTPATKEDSIINFLPYQGFSFDIRADTTTDHLVLRANLNLTSKELSGDEAANRQTIAFYKSEVEDWIKAKGFEPSKYKIIYNFNDDGSVYVDLPDAEGTHTH